MTIRKFVSFILLSMVIFSIAGCSTARADYIDAMNPKIDAYDKALVAFNKQLAVTDANSFNDPDWDAKMREVLAAWRQAGDGLKDMGAPVPPEAEALDKIAKQISDETNLAIDAYTQGLDTQNGDFFAEGDKHADEINRLLGELNAEVDKMNGK
jgi:hypothetical protein